MAYNGRSFDQGNDYTLSNTGTFSNPDINCTGNQGTSYACGVEDEADFARYLNENKSTKLFERRYVNGRLAPQFSKDDSKVYFKNFGTFHIIDITGLNETEINWYDASWSSNDAYYIKSYDISPNGEKIVFNSDSAKITYIKNKTVLTIVVCG